MSKKFQLQIPEPCHEDWNKMTPGDKGRFCNSCQKTVVDFTSMSDMQLIAFFKKPSTGSVCGRFYNDQLERDFEIPGKRIPWLKYFFQFAIPVFLTGLKSYSQGKPMIKENNDTAVCNSIISGDIDIMRSSVAPVLKNEILGKVVDENGKGISYATVIIKGTKNGTACDSAGNFYLRISEKQTPVFIVASAVGYSSVEKQINIVKDSSTEIILQTYTALGGEVIVACSSRTRLGGFSIRSIRVSYMEKVKGFFKSDSIKVFPNPAKAGNEIKIEWRRAEAGEYKIDLYSLQGQIIKSSLARIENKINSFTFQIPATIPGNYLLRMTNKKSGKKYAEKIIIQ
jgi:hypothetical protein